MIGFTHDRAGPSRTGCRRRRDQDRAQAMHRPPDVLHIERRAIERQAG